MWNKISFECSIEPYDTLLILNRCNISHRYQLTFLVMYNIGSIRTWLINGKSTIEQGSTTMCFENKIDLIIVLCLFRTQFWAFKFIVFGYNLFKREVLKIVVLGMLQAEGGEICITTRQNYRVYSDRQMNYKVFFRLENLRNNFRYLFFVKSHKPKVVTQ